MRRPVLVMAGGVLLAVLGFAALMQRPEFARWLYRGRRPHRIARFFMRSWATVGSLGVAPDILVTLEVTGRTSGRTVSLPLVPAQVDGERYLVSMLGDDVQWVRNVRAAGGKAVLRSGAREDVILQEIPPAGRAPILRAYVRRTPGARPHVRVAPDASLAEFEKIAAEYPVFRVTPA